MHPDVSRPGGHWGAAGLCLLLLLLSALSACGELPRPFQPAAKAVNLKQLNHEASIVIQQPEGAPASAEFGMELAKALQMRGLRATTDANGGANLLLGNAEVIPLDDGLEVVFLQLSLADGEGQEIARVEEQAAFPQGGWANGDGEMFSQLAERTAASLAEQLGLGEPQSADTTRGHVIVMPVVGPDGEVDETLTGALKAQLRRRSIALAGVPGPRDVTVEGAVSLDPLEPGWQQVALVWRVVGAADGEELGTVDQGNRIPEGTLDDGWGPSSSLVAAGAAAGISQILQELEIDYFK